MPEKKTTNIDILKDIKLASSLHPIVPLQVCGRNGFKTSMTIAMVAAWVYVCVAGTQAFSNRTH